VPAADPHILTLFEHESPPFAWTARDVAALEQLRTLAGGDVLRATVKNGASVLQAAQFVGVVRLGGRTIQILPKMFRPGAGSDTDRAEHARQAARNLLHLLAYARNLPLRETPRAPLRDQATDWFEILTRLFASHLWDEWRRGPLRGYVAFDHDRSSVLRGRWRVAEQIRRPWEKHVFAITADEFSADNRLNRVLRFVVERLWHLTRDADNRRALGELRQAMEADGVVLPGHVRASDAAPGLLSRLHGRFASLLALARLFLQGGGLELLAGRADTPDTFAFVFDMNRLFEEFVWGFLARHKDEILPGELRNCVLLPQTRGAQRHLALRAADSRPVFRLEPDIAFQAPNGSFPLLLDTKYKPLDPARNAVRGVSQADFYQMFAYAHAYDCSRVLLLYPQTETSGRLRERFTTGNPPREITAATIDLRLDLGSPAGKQSLTNELRDCLTWGENQ